MIFCHLFPYDQYIYGNKQSLRATNKHLHKREKKKIREYFITNSVILMNSHIMICLSIYVVDTHAQAQICKHFRVALLYLFVLNESGLL